MTCDVEHTVVKSKDLSNPPNPQQIHGSNAGFKNQFSSEKTYSRVTKRDSVKRLKHAPGSGLGLSVFIYTPNSKPTGSPNYKIIIFIRKLVLAFASKDFPRQLFGIHIEGIFFLVISDQYSYKK